MLWKWCAFSQIAPPPSKNNFAPPPPIKENKFHLAISACCQNFFYDMCATPADIVEEYLQRLAGCIGLASVAFVLSLRCVHF
jgi:hypothetical protein